MTDYKKDIIMVYHIPVDGLSRQRSTMIIREFMEQFHTGDFYQELFLPKTNSGGKIDIEIINLKGQKTEHVKVKLEELQDLLMKYFEKDKWLRKQKLSKII